MAKKFTVTQSPDRLSISSSEDGHKKKRKWLVPLLVCLLILFLVAAIAIPVIIVYTTSKDNGDRIACFPLIRKINFFIPI